jgi:hypothetical protein
VIIVIPGPTSTSCVGSFAIVTNFFILAKERKFASSSFNIPG